MSFWSRARVSRVLEAHRHKVYKLKDSDITSAGSTETLQSSLLRWGCLSPELYIYISAGRTARLSSQWPAALTSNESGKLFFRWGVYKFTIALLFIQRRAERKGLYRLQLEQRSTRRFCNYIDLAGEPFNITRNLFPPTSLSVSPQGQINPSLEHLFPRN